jgi:hypothetical protein
MPRGVGAANSRCLFPCVACSLFNTLSILSDFAAVVHA